MPVADRIKTLMGTLKSGEGLLISNIKNVRYLTGFTGSSGYALITRQSAFMLTDFRYEEQAKEEVGGRIDVVIRKKRLGADLKKLFKTSGISRLLVESSVSYEFYEGLSAFRPMAVKDAVEKIRAVKDAEELESIKEAVRRAEEAFCEVRPFIRTGASERAIALRLEEKIKKKGSRRIPFDIIVASGSNSAKPHAAASDKKLMPGDLVLVDWGAEAGGYFSDMTRTLLVKGKDMAPRKEIYNLVLKAQQEGIRAVRAGAAAGEIDGAARDIIKAAGYGSRFGHSLGHGIGLDVHELPNIRGAGRQRVKENMVFTVEPGVYVPGLGGVRIEDMLLVREDGALRLTSLSRGLDIIH